MKRSINCRSRNRTLRVTITFLIAVTLLAVFKSIHTEIPIEEKPIDEQTLPQFPSEMEPTDSVWKIVNGTKHRFFVFSAYYERRDNRQIRVIGATKTFRPDKVWCRMWYRNEQNGTVFRSSTVLANVQVSEEP